MHGHGATLLLTIAFTEKRDVGTTKNVWNFMRIADLERWLLLCRHRCTLHKLNSLVGRHTDLAQILPEADKSITRTSFCYS